MGVLPLEYKDGETADSLGLDGTEQFTIKGISEGLEPGQVFKVTAKKQDGSTVEFEAKSRLDSGIEVEYYKNGGILNYVLREFLKNN
jgi:aconitate hydratase